MAIALASFAAYGTRGEEALSKRYKQTLRLTFTGANTDVDYDIGEYVSGSLGSLWTAIGGSGNGASALACLQDIATRYQSFLGVKGASGQGSLVVMPAAATAGGSATEAVTVTGITAADRILAVRLIDDGPNNVTLAATMNTGVVAAGAGAVSVTFSADPGAGTRVTFLVQKAYASAPQVINTNAAANLLYVSGSAPTSWTAVLEWELQEGVLPVEVAS